MTAPDFTVDGEGVLIGVFADGRGEIPLVMVHGSIADHTTFDALVEELAPTFATYRMDRRGFGASGDSSDYAIEHEFADVAAVVEEVSVRSGSPVAVFGHSYGANCALGATVSSSEVSHLVLYEPSFGLHYPDGCIESIEEALDRKDRDAAIAAVLSTILGMSEDEIDTYRRNPVWPDRVRAAHTVPRECRVEQEGSFRSTTWTPGCPTVVMTGSQTSHDLAAIARDAVTAIEGAQLRVLESQDHMAPQAAPELVASNLVAIVQE